jgi:hypothetical protein
MHAVFSIYFEGPFWVGVLESEDGGELRVARHVFGAEPSGPELLDFMLHRFADLPRFRSPSSSGGGEVEAASRPLSPKRALREARRDVARPASTKAQAALAEAREAAKAGGKASCREARSEAEELRFAERELRRKEKRRGH